MTSLRFRMLVPLLVASVIAAGVLAIASFRLGQNWALDDVFDRVRAIKRTLRGSTFPLTPAVMQSLADLTDGEFVILDADQRIVLSTLDAPLSGLPQTPPTPNPVVEQLPTLTVDDQSYLHDRFLRGSGPNSREEIVMLFDQTRIDEAGRRAALLPLATGLSMIVLLTGFSIALSGRLIGRLVRLQQHVQSVAQGNFRSGGTDTSTDELGQLGLAVDDMAMQLDGLWKTVNRQQGERLLHQVAGGMAHQLRNSLTGARMAVELHQNECSVHDDEGLSLAIRQMNTAEDYVHRLLLVASGREGKDCPMTAGECLDHLEKSLSPIAKHRRIALNWQVDENVPQCLLRDGPLWIAAVTNLIENAMQASDCVCVRGRRDADQALQIIVIDDGPGIEPEVAEDVFEPFVTTKPEGMGLGLSVVKRAARHHGGNVRWFRDADQTRFELTVPAEPL